MASHEDMQLVTSRIGQRIEDCNEWQICPCCGLEKSAAKSGDYTHEPGCPNGTIQVNKESQNLWILGYGDGYLNANKKKLNSVSYDLGYSIGQNDSLGRAIGF